MELILEVELLNQYNKLDNQILKTLRAATEKMAAP